MKLSKKHETQQPIIRADFSGGLNTSTNVDGIAENQLSVAVNVEVDHATGRLRTVAGTVAVDIPMPFPIGDEEGSLENTEEIFAAMYDEIKRELLLVTQDMNNITAKKRIFAVNIESEEITEIGTLNGNLYPVSTSWEDGILIASGSKLQYYNSTELKELDSPNATSVYIRAGRVLITSGNNIYYSYTGDEETWVEDTNDDASAKFVEAGYKDGGKLIGMINLSTDVLLIKDNRRLYRLSGEYPNWQMNEVSRNVEVSGRLSFCSVADSVFILGRNEVQNIQTTNFYGDVKPQNVATLITSEIQKLPPNTILRHVPPLNQVWAINGKVALVFDLVTQSWYKREFNSEVVDVLPIGDEVLVVKKKQLTRLSNTSFYDDGSPLHWRWQGQRLVSQHDYLLKRTQVSVIPMSTGLYTGFLRVGGVVITLPIPERSTKIYNNDSNIYKNRVKICLGGRRRFVYMKGDMIYENLTQIYGNKQKLFSHPSIIAESRNVYRNKFIDIGGQGVMSGVVFNSVVLDIAEV